MTSSLSVAVALSVALVPGFAPTPARAPDATTAVPLFVYDGGAIVVQVTIASSGPYRFLLDTGSTRSAISSRLARQLRTPLTAKTTMVTPAGSLVRDVTYLPALQIGHSEPASVSAMILPDDALAGGNRADGVLGQDVLGGRSYTIDYERRELVWHDAGIDHLTGHRLPLARVNGLPFVSVSGVGGTSGPVRLVADSGADALVLFAAAGGAIRSSAPMETGVLRTSAGLQVGHRILLDQLDLGSVRLRHQPALLLPGREATGLLGDGLLPLRLFARVTFDATASVLIVATR